MVGVLNFCVNGLLLAGVARQAGRRASPLGVLGGALLGAVYAVGCMAPGFGFLGGLHWRLVSLGLMGLVAYGWDGRLCCAFAVLNLALGSAVMGAPWQLALYGVGVLLLGRFAFGSGGRRLLPVQIAGFGKRVCLTALLDTGNELRDPITAEPVLVIGCQAAGALTGLTVEQLRRPLDTMSAPPLPGLRLIPFRAVGAEHGLLLAMRFPEVRMGGRTRPAIVAFAPQSFGEDYQALAGGSI